MFYKWFMWQWEVSDVDISESISKWNVSLSSLNLFIEYYARIFSGKKMKG